MLPFAFWGLVFIVFYTYIGYGILLWILVKIKGLFVKNKPYNTNFAPDVTLVVAAYNEDRWIEDKIRNSVDQVYLGTLNLVFVTDGSTDATPDLIAAFPQTPGRKIELYHKPERMGKIAAVNRIMPLITTPIVIYTDANTDLNKDAVANMVRHFANEKVGAVSGEKRIHSDEKAEASGAGEGIYWKYESTLKRLDSTLYSVVGAAGELFGIRRSLFETIPEDTIVEDFYTTMRIAQRGYKVVYEPEACASEGHSASVADELKRKIRIGAGGFQAISRLLPLLNPFKYGVLTFQYVSHRVLRWTLAPLALPLIFLTNLVLAIQGEPIYQWIFIAQIVFYFLAFMGYLMERRKLKVKAFFVPYYFCIMNYALFRGFGRFIKGSQSVVWERAARA
jgi:poly-beta-1,6-N-acetyl-D-glucosamine synthase